MPLQFSNRLVQCGSTQPSGPCHRRDSSMPQKPRIRRCHQPPLPFVQIRIQESMFCTQSGIVGHDGIIYFSRQKVQLILAGLLSSVHESEDFGKRCTAISTESLQSGNKDAVHWVFPITQQTEALVEDLHASRRMIAKYDHAASQQQLRDTDEDLLQTERS